MRFEFFISRRYLASRERRGIISLITIISVGGVAVGVAALIVVIAVMDGFDRELMDRIMGSWSHLIVQRVGNQGIVNYREILEAADRDPDVVSAAPVLIRQALLQGGKLTYNADDMVPVQIQGFDLEREPAVTKFMRETDFGTSQPGQREIVLGYVLREQLSTERTGPVYLHGDVYAITRLGKFGVGARAKTPRLRVGGIFQTGLYEIDARIAYMSLPEAQDIFFTEDEYKDVVDQIRIRVRDPYDLQPAITRLSETLRGMGSGFVIRGWHQLNPEFFSALKLEKIVMFIILLLIVLVAAFNIIGTLVMIVIEKTREIGILRSMGTTQRQILAIFMMQGLIVGGLGISVGCVVGIVITAILDRWKIPLPEGVYGIQDMPVLIRWETIALIVASALAICLLASLIPAWRAAKLHPTAALRYE